MSHVLITGCSGFLASHLLNTLKKEKGNRLFGFTEIAGFSHTGLKTFRCDIRDEERVLDVIRKVQPEIVFHFAAVTNVAYAWKNPRQTYEINFVGSCNLLEGLRQVAPEARTLMMSSAEVYGRSDRPISESGAIDCRNPYSLSKRAMEMLADLYGETYGLPIIKVRSFNFTGPGQEKRFVASEFAAQIADIEKGKQPPLMRVGNLQSVRDFSDVRDIAFYLNVLARKGEPGATYNLCSGRGSAIRQILEMLMAFSRKKIRVEIDPEKFRPLDTPVLIGDPSRIRMLFGLYPQFTIEQTLADLLDHWRNA